MRARIILQGFQYLLATATLAALLAILSTAAHAQFLPGDEVAPSGRPLAVAVNAPTDKLRKPHPLLPFAVIGLESR